MAVQDEGMQSLVLMEAVVRPDYQLQSFNRPFGVDTMTYEDFSRKFDEDMSMMIDRIKETLFEQEAEPRWEVIMAQLMMEFLSPHDLDVENIEGFDFRNALTTEQKQNLVVIADHMGPDYAQMLYRVSVFITKIA